MSVVENSPLWRRAAAASSLVMSLVAWGMAVGLPETILHRPIVRFAIYALAAAALAAGVVGSRRNKRFLAWRLIADAGLVLGLVLVLIGIVALIMFIKGWTFV